MMARYRIEWQMGGELEVELIDWTEEEVEMETLNELLMRADEVSDHLDDELDRGVIQASATATATVTPVD